MALIVRELELGDEEAFFEGLRAWDGHPPTWHTFAWKPGVTYAEMLGILADQAAGRNLAPGRVPSAMLYGFADGRIVGRVSVRHELNEYLLHRGGHIGYAVAPEFRRRGYGAALMAAGMERCRKLGLERILVTCDEDNLPSRRIIERFGGELEDTRWDAEDQTTICRYWVELGELESSTARRRG